MESKELKQTKIITAFGPVELPPQQAKDPCFEEDIVDTLIIDTFEKDAEDHIIPVTKQIVTGKKNRKAYIESFSDDVGLENILKKIGQGAISEDKYSILKEQAPGSVSDLRGFQDINNLGDMESLARKAHESFARLDPDLKKGMSFKEFCSKFNNDDLVKYVESKTKKFETTEGDENK